MWDDSDYGDLNKYLTQIDKILKLNRLDRGKFFSFFYKFSNFEGLVDKIIEDDTRDLYLDETSYVNIDYSFEISDMFGVDLRSNLDDFYTTILDSLYSPYDKLIFTETHYLQPPSKSISNDSIKIYFEKIKKMDSDYSDDDIFMSFYLLLENYKVTNLAYIICESIVANDYASNRLQIKTLLKYIKELKKFFGDNKFANAININLDNLITFLYGLLINPYDIKNFDVEVFEILKDFEEFVENNIVFKIFSESHFKYNNDGKSVVVNTLNDNLYGIGNLNLDTQLSIYVKTLNTYLIENFELIDIKYTSLLLSKISSLLYITKEQITKEPIYSNPNILIKNKSITENLRNLYKNRKLNNGELTLVMDGYNIYEILVDINLAISNFNKFNQKYSKTEPNYNQDYLSMKQHKEIEKNYYDLNNLENFVLDSKDLKYSYIINNDSFTNLKFDYDNTPKKIPINLKENILLDIDYLIKELKNLDSIIIVNSYYISDAIVFTNKFFSLVASDLKFCSKGIYETYIKELYNYDFSHRIASDPKYLTLKAYKEVIINHQHETDFYIYDEISKENQNKRDNYITLKFLENIGILSDINSGRFKLDKEKFIDRIYFVKDFIENLPTE